MPPRSKKSGSVKADSQDAIRKLQPKLRMVANSSVKVGVLRAERSSCIAVKSDSLAEKYGTAPGLEVEPKSIRELKKTVKRGKQREVPSNVYVNVFIETSDTDDSRLKSKAFVGESARRGNIVSATVPLDKLESIAARSGVNHIVQVGENLTTGVWTKAS